MIPVAEEESVRVAYSAHVHAALNASVTSLRQHYRGEITPQVRTARRQGASQPLQLLSARLGVPASRAIFCC
jgi:hypothetical protein